MSKQESDPTNTSIPAFGVRNLMELSIIESAEIRIDNSDISEIDFVEILQRYAILGESDVPIQTIIFAKRTASRISFGILANMGGGDTAGVYATHDNELSELSVTKKCPRRKGYNKYDHTITEGNTTIKDPANSNILNECYNIFVTKVDADAKRSQ